MPRLRRILLVLLPATLLPLAFILDVIRTAVDLEIGGIEFIHELLLISSFILIFWWFEGRSTPPRRNVPKELGRLLIYHAGLLVVVGLFSFATRAGAGEAGDLSLRQVTVRLLGVYVIGTLFVVVSIVTLHRLRLMVLFKRTKGVRRNFSLYAGGLLMTSAFELPGIPIEARALASLLFVFTVLMAVVNSFKQGWIVFLSRREKVYAIVYAVLLFLVVTVLDVLLAQRSGGQRAMLGFSQPLHTFVQLNCLFVTVYAGMAFVSTLFHLPTAEAFERKQSELNSLHDLGRLVTQVFDLSDLVKTVTEMATEVCGARSAWLELIEGNDAADVPRSRVVAKQHITHEQIAALRLDQAAGFQRVFSDGGRYVLIEDIWTDRRTRHLKGSGVPRCALLGIPLRSHGDLVGVLYACKDAEQAFDQDDMDVMAAFADHATIAIENARLIARSLERERLQQEMMVAQRMQKRLLPQSMPVLPNVQFAAVSESSAEVGGDYYDLFHLDDERYGLVVADVAGKGVSAAFYMAEMKGIFLSLTRLYRSPRELLVQANRALLESLEKNAFISVVYAVLDTNSGELVLSRAGHCPVVVASSAGVELVRPNGLGLGLTHGKVFEEATEERTLRLRQNDVCVFYTDGVTEARNGEGEEFGYERLREVVQRHRQQDAAAIKEGIVREIRTFLGNCAYTDDMTLVVIKWLAE